MIEDIVNQEKIVKKNQQAHINSMCELIKTEISTFQQYQLEQMDITTYIEAMQNILNSQNNQYTDFNAQLEKLNNMIKQQVKLSNLIDQMKQNENKKKKFEELKEKYKFIHRFKYEKSEFLNAIEKGEWILLDGIENAPSSIIELSTIDSKLPSLSASRTPLLTAPFSVIVLIAS